MIYENENDADGILKILKELHEYVPFAGDGEERKYGSQGIVGDQLTVERAVNAHMTLSNGFTPDERMDGLHCEIADWHGGNKALGVSILYPFFQDTTISVCFCFSLKLIRQCKVMIKGPFLGQLSCKYCRLRK